MAPLILLVLAAAPAPAQEDVPRRHSPWINYNRPQSGTPPEQWWTPERVVASKVPLFAVDGGLGQRRDIPKAQHEIEFVRAVKAIDPEHPVWNRLRIEVYAPSKGAGTLPGFDLEWLATLPIEEWEEDFEPWRRLGYTLESHPDTRGFWSKAVEYWTPLGRMPVPYLMYVPDSKRIQVSRLVLDIGDPGYLEWLVVNARYILEVGHGDAVFVGVKTDMWAKPQKQRALPGNGREGAMTRSPFEDWRTVWTAAVCRLHDEGIEAWSRDYQSDPKDRANWWTKYGAWRCTGKAERQFNNFADYERWNAHGRPVSRLPK